MNEIMVNRFSCFNIPIAIPPRQGQFQLISPFGKISPGGWSSGSPSWTWGSQRYNLLLNHQPIMGLKKCQDNQPTHLAWLSRLLWSQENSFVSWFFLWRLLFNLLLLQFLSRNFWTHFCLERGQGIISVTNKKLFFHEQIRVFIHRVTKKLGTTNTQEEPTNIFQFIGKYSSGYFDMLGLQFKQKYGIGCKYSTCTYII